jgi:hypothetical protein
MSVLFGSNLQHGLRGESVSCMQARRQALGYNLKVKNCGEAVRTTDEPGHPPKSSSIKPQKHARTLNKHIMHMAYQCWLRGLLPTWGEVLNNATGSIYA